VYLEQCFFFHFGKVACGATSALHVVLNWLKLRFVGNCFWPHSQIIYLQVAVTLFSKVKFLALLSDLKVKKSGYASN
jgi:hypothetical protein